jgi:hypothetical protein
VLRSQIDRVRPSLAVSILPPGARIVVDSGSLRHADRLLDHLDEHVEHHRAIWLTMDLNRRYLLLDGFVASTSEGTRDLRPPSRGRGSRGQKDSSTGPPACGRC